MIEFLEEEDEGDEENDDENEDGIYERQVGGRYFQIFSQVIRS